MKGLGRLWGCNSKHLLVHHISELDSKELRRYISEPSSLHNLVKVKDQRKTEKRCHSHLRSCIVNNVVWDGQHLWKNSHSTSKYHSLFVNPPLLSVDVSSRAEQSQASKIRSHRKCDFHQSTNWIMERMW